MDPIDPQPDTAPARRRVSSPLALGIAAGLGGLAIGLTGVAAAASTPSPSPSTSTTTPGDDAANDNAVPPGPGGRHHCPKDDAGGAPSTGGDSTPQTTTPSTGATPSV